MEQQYCQVCPEQQKDSNKNHDFHLQFLPRHLTHNGVCLFDLVARSLVFVVNVHDQVALLPQILLRVIIDVDSCNTDFFDVLQLRILIVEGVISRQ